MNEYPIIGIYAPNKDALAVYFDAVSGEVFYEDEMGNNYLLTGFDVDTTRDNSGVFSEMEEALAATADNIVGVVKSGNNVWLLRDDNRCYLVPSNDMKVTAAIEAAEYEDDMEYEPEDSDD